MNTNRGLRRLAVAALAGALLGAGGCARWDALMRADQIEREARAGEARSLQRQSDEYFLVGMEYYSLARAAEKAGDATRAKDCAAKAGLYNTLAKGLAHEAEEARTEPAAASVSPGASANPQANPPASAPPPAVTPSPLGASSPAQPGAAPLASVPPAAPTQRVAQASLAAAGPASAAVAAQRTAQSAASASPSATTLPELPPASRGGDAARNRP